MNFALAAVGDVADPRCWSGIPFHFWRAALRAGIAAEPWRVHPERLRGRRMLWNAAGIFSGRGPGGFQYSPGFLAALEAQVPAELWQGEILTFHQHFPRAASVAAHGGKLQHYLDAPFAALASGRGLDLRLPRRVVERALALERENYAASERVVFMARWAAEVALAECGVSADRASVILPGANLDLPEDWDFPAPAGRAGRDRPFTLGFVGKDWRRKGLPLLVDTCEELVRRGWKARVLAAGEAPPDLRRAPLVEFAGWIDKAKDPAGFLSFLTRGDVGCLFSEREALGISTLEFLRAGVPVAGFAHEGPADTLPPDAGFRFPAGSGAVDLADAFAAYLKDETRQAAFRERARQWSRRVTWERCVAEFAELWETGSVAHPVRPWLGWEDRDA